MPILAVKNEIEVELTHKCNWNCPYCAIQTHSLPDISNKEMITKIKQIQRNSFVTLSGGEPGTLDKRQICNIIDILQQKSCVINLNTNGLFLQRYLDLTSNFNQIIYHCSENLDNIVKQFDVQCELRYMIVITDDNFSKLDTFLRKHTDIIFDIIPASYDDEYRRPLLSLTNRHKVLAKFSSQMTKESIKRMIHDKDWSIMSFI